MTQPTVQNSADLSRRIKQRRLELGLTIEEAASKAGVGTKTWSRYESGGSIRRDKIRGICKALNWQTLTEPVDAPDRFDIEEYRKYDCYPVQLEKTAGPLAAASFVIGSELILGNLSEDIEALSSMPKGSHIGQLDMSFIASDLPPQFLMKYDYEFLLLLRSRVIHFRRAAQAGQALVAHSVLDELTLCLIMEESGSLMELLDYRDTEFESDPSAWEGWAYELFDDCDLVTFLFSGEYLPSAHPYHYSRWLEEQFWTD